MLGPEKCLDEIIDYSFAVPTFLSEKNASIFCNRVIATNTTSSNNTNRSSTNFAGISVHTCILLHGYPNSAHVSENANETHTDTTMTFTILIVSIEQN